VLSRGRYKNMSELAQAMGISVSQVYRVRRGDRKINEGFILGAAKAFPEQVNRGLALQLSTRSKSSLWRGLAAIMKAPSSSERRTLWLSMMKGLFRSAYRTSLSSWGTRSRLLAAVKRACLFPEGRLFRPLKGKLRDGRRRG
jgi:transcriptional regulator with XRE-family HTH domain